MDKNRQYLAILIVIIAIILVVWIIYSCAFNTTNNVSSGNEVLSKNISSKTLNLDLVARQIADLENALLEYVYLFRLYMIEKINNYEGRHSTLSKLHKNYSTQGSVISKFFDSEAGNKYVSRLSQKEGIFNSLIDDNLCKKDSKLEEYNHTLVIINDQVSDLFENLTGGQINKSKINLLMCHLDDSLVKEIKFLTDKNYDSSIVELNNSIDKAGSFSSYLGGSLWHLASHQGFPGVVSL